MPLFLIVIVVVLAVAVIGGTAFISLGGRRRSPPDAAWPGVEPPVPPAPKVSPAAEAPTEPDLPADLEQLPIPMANRLGRARSLVSGYFAAVRARSGIDAASWEELEEALIRADVGITTTTAMLDVLRAKVDSGLIASPEALLQGLKAEMVSALAAHDRTLNFADGVTNVWLFVGVNGVGKTTTIGKVGLSQMGQGHSVVMAAGDTFRAAAGEQLELWAERAGAELVRGSEGADPSSVIFNAIEKAVAQKTDLVLADTAGRLHTKTNLMEELRKVRRVAERPPARLTEVLLVIDATTGQNGLVQARQFTEAAGVTGVVLTKLDGTAKGGIALTIQTELGLPLKLVGLGEGAGDL
ncbi:MAG: signal recognition particle-docking protein FtsY, partial [Acidimicrobiales bacterium]